MGRALRIYWWALRNAYEELFTLGLINLAWWGIGFGLPLGASYLGVQWLSLILLLLLVPPPTAGVHYCANRMAHDKPISFGLFWEGTKKYAVKSWLLGWLGLLVSAIIAANIVFYGGYEGTWTVWVQALFFSMLLYWSVIQVYAFPMLLELKEEKLLLALRNALFLVLSSPLLALLLAVLVVATIALSLVLVLPAVFIMTGLVALIANRGLVELLTAYRKRVESSSAESNPDDPAADT